MVAHVETRRRSRMGENMGNSEIILPKAKYRRYINEIMTFYATNSLWHGFEWSSRTELKVLEGVYKWMEATDAKRKKAPKS